MRFFTSLFFSFFMMTAAFSAATPATTTDKTVTVSATHTITTQADSEKNETAEETKHTLTQDEANNEPEKPGHIWNLSNVNIRSVIAEVSRETGRNFLIDPRVQGTVSIISAQPLSSKEIYPVFLSMLQVAGYGAVPSGDVTKIIPIMDVRGESSNLLNTLKSPPKGDELMVQVIQVRYGSAEQLVPILRSLMPQYSTVSAYAPSNMLILTGRANNIRQLADIINQVDNSSVNGIDVVPLQYALAMDVVKTLKELIKTPGQQTTFAADDRSNAILIGGTKPERLKLRVLIARLDKQNPLSGHGNTQVIYLSYLRAEDVVPILGGIAQASFSGTVGMTIGTVTRPVLDSTNPESSLVGGSTGVGSSPSASLTSAVSAAGGNQAAGSSSQSEGSSKPSIQIIAEPNTNSIIINAPATVIRTLKSVIRQLDIKPAQLLVEALIAEINETDVQNLGVEWGSLTGANDSLFRAGFAVVNHASINQLQAQIYALARQRRANILSTPSVVVLDNRQAKILIGKQVSVATSSYPNNAGGTTTASPFTTFDRMNVALHLYVRPQITRGQGIQLQIDQGNDSLEPTSTTDSKTNPTFNISAILTSVHVNSGDVIVLGGLAQDSLGNDNLSIPILGDLPGLGRLFQHNVANREKKILMVFIRPTILKTEKDEYNVTTGKYSDTRLEQIKIERFQEQFDQRDRDTVLKPLYEADLPKPFCQTPQCKAQAMMTK
jgi:general secretion pathway protein D